MSEKFKNKYRITSARLQNWDYSTSGMYFITICTANREHFFGEIKKGKMHLNEIGQWVTQQWLKTFEMRPDMNLQMGEYVVMPNHFHAIIIIGDNKYNTHRGALTHRRDAMHCVSTATADATTTTATNKFGPQYKNLASIIRGFKSSVTTMARKNGNVNFGWQPRFHDHIIRNNKSFENISNYITNNPLQWKEDKFY
jgi:REP element-mobilizing transposase RayT